MALRSGTGVALTNAGNDVDTLAFNNTAGSVAYRDTNALIIGSVDGLTASSNTGLPTTAITTGGDLTLSISLTSAGTVTLVSGGAVTELPPVIAPSLSVTAVGPVLMTDANQVGTLAASVTGAGNAFTFRNDSLDLTIGTVGGVSGITTNGGAITLQTTTSGNLILSQPVSTGSSSVSTVTLNSAGTITGSGSGAITAGTLTGTSGGDTSLVRPNAVGTLGSFTSGGKFDFRTTTALAETGPVSASGDLTLEVGGVDAQRQPDGERPGRHRLGYFDDHPDRRHHYRNDIVRQLEWRHQPARRQFSDQSGHLHQRRCRRLCLDQCAGADCDRRGRCRDRGARPDGIRQFGADGGPAGGQQRPHLDWTISQTGGIVTAAIQAGSSAAARHDGREPEFRVLSGRSTAPAAVC
jgi:hypothetical protein